MSPTNTVSSLNKELVDKVRYLSRNLYHCQEIIAKLEEENEYFKRTVEAMNKPAKKTGHVHTLCNHK